jgi:phosphoenolpyruvate synthase/pyruvate phosphate dikinase
VTCPRTSHRADDPDNDWVVDLSAVVATDAPTVGGKAANLSELVGARSVTAARPSAVGEGAADCSFSGMNASFTNVRDPDEALQRVVDC